jgi:hypothetical protein
VHFASLWETVNAYEVLKHRLVTTG